ncbi:MAG TPA: phosphate/phosphite/phosphonate ABC transporter substrate-binding protein [Burkholderiales bacterium]
MTRRLGFRLLCAAALALCAHRASAAEKPYDLGILPYLPLTRIHDLYGPMAADLSAKLGRQVRLSSKADYSGFRDELRQQTYDIGFVQPFDYVDAHDKYGYLPLARRAERLDAVIVVREDSALRAIKDLQGRTIATPPVDAAVSHLTSMALRDAGIDPESGVKRYYGKNHFACLQSVAIGAADACGMAEGALRTIEKERQTTDRFRILHKTASIPPALFVVHGRVAGKDRAIMLKTILDWPNTEEGRKIIERGQFTPFVAASDAEYEAVRRYLRSKE